MKTVRLARKGYDAHNHDDHTGLDMWTAIQTCNKMTDGDREVLRLMWAVLEDLKGRGSW